jgi:hypothetical protein
MFTRDNIQGVAKILQQTKREPLALKTKQINSIYTPPYMWFFKFNLTIPFKNKYLTYVIFYL